jgi:heme oxygenase (biliverdin-IX-beta and delta-forming)
MAKPPMDDERSDPATLSRGLMRAADRAMLATIMAADGWPFGTLAMCACDHDASPLLLLSDLARHSRNLAADDRATLLFDGTAGLDDPLTGPRLSVLGRLAPCADGRLAARYLARHPSAAGFAGFADFRLYRMAVSHAHLVAGFGVIERIEAADLLLDGAPIDGFAPIEAEILATIALAPGGYGAGWTVTGADPEGLDLRRGGAVARLPFVVTVTNSEAARTALAALDGPAHATRLQR